MLTINQLVLERSVTVTEDNCTSTPHERLLPLFPDTPPKRLPSIDVGIRIHFHLKFFFFFFYFFLTGIFYWSYLFLSFSSEVLVVGLRRLQLNRRRFLLFSFFFFFFLSVGVVFGRRGGLVWFVDETGRGLVPFKPSGSSHHDTRVRTEHNYQPLVIYRIFWYEPPTHFSPCEKVL